MPRVTFDFETNEEMIEFIKSFPENETSATASSHDTRPDTYIIPQDEEDVKDEFEGEQIVFEFETEEEQINRALAPCHVRLTRGNSGSINVIGCIEFTKKRFRYCRNDLEKFREPIFIIEAILPDDIKRFYGNVYKETCKFVDKFYRDPAYNRQNIIDYIGTTNVESLLVKSDEYGGLSNYLKHAHDYHKHNRLGGRSA